MTGVRVELSGIGAWRHDLGHCLHATFGVLLRFYGVDPLDVLGSAWHFGYRAGDVRREEYYFPCLRGPLATSLAPYHPISSYWHEPVDAEQGWQQVRDTVAAGRPVAVAADNFHLPFRPAYRDVHTNHLLVVYGFTADRVLVADPVPPSFQGAISIAQLTAARDSDNPARHDRDMFFTANPIANRWLDLRIDGSMPELTPCRLHDVLAANLESFRRPDDGGPEYHGLAGQARFLADSAKRLAGADPGAVDEIFVVAGVALAVTGLHGDFLAAAARRFGDPTLAELARQVDRVAHHWSAIRILTATGRDHGAAAGRSLRERARMLLDDHAAVLDGLARRASSSARQRP